MSDYAAVGVRKHVCALESGPRQRRSPHSNPPSGLTGYLRVPSFITLNTGQVTAFAEIPTNELAGMPNGFPTSFWKCSAASCCTCPRNSLRQRFVPAIFSSRISRPQGSAQHVGDREENGSHYGCGERSRRASGKSSLRDALSRAR